MTMAAAEEDEGYSDHDEAEIRRDSSFYESTQNRKKKKQQLCNSMGEHLSMEAIARQKKRGGRDGEESRIYSSSPSSSSCIACLNAGPERLVGS